MNKQEQWRKIAINYEQERDTLSFPSLLLDDLVVSMVSQSANVKVLDFGAGSGTIARRLDKKKSHIVAYEPIKPMRNLCKKMTPSAIYKKISIIGDLRSMTPESIDSVICINVLNHINNLNLVLKKINSYLKTGGQLIMVIPHPFKDMGFWQKKQVNGQWQYLDYVAGDYMKEGQVTRTREDINGNVVVKKVAMSHRKVSTYFNALINAGFEVKQLIEPEPAKSSKKIFSVLYAKSSRIPYFLVMECYKR